MPVVMLSGPAGGVYRYFYSMFEGLPEHEIEDDDADVRSRSDVSPS